MIVAVVCIIASTSVNWGRLVSVVLFATCFNVIIVR